MPGYVQSPETVNPGAADATVSSATTGGSYAGSRRALRGHGALVKALVEQGVIISNTCLTLSLTL